MKSGEAPGEDGICVNFFKDSEAAIKKNQNFHQMSRGRKNAKSLKKWNRNIDTERTRLNISKTIVRLACCHLSRHYPAHKNSEKENTLDFNQHRKQAGFESGSSDKNYNYAVSQGKKKSGGGGLLTVILSEAYLPVCIPTP